MSNETNILQERNRIPNYYEALGRSHDYLLRCKDCQELVQFEKLTKLGSCTKCGNKRFVEVSVLSEDEHRRIASGELQFLDSDKFLAEFTGVEV